MIKGIETQLSNLASSTRLQLLFTLAGFVLFSIGMKWASLQHWGSDLPYWDQWETEGLHMLIPLSDGNLDLITLFFAPHNEHRIGWTRLWTLAITVWNQQWDPHLVSTVNAVVHAAAGAYLVRKLWPLGNGLSRLFIAATTLALFTSPITYENLVFSFQIQYYFLIAAALLQIGFLSDSETWSWRWMVGILAGVFGLWTMASGFLASVALIILQCVKIRHRGKWLTSDLITIGVCAFLAVVGFLSINHVPANERASLPAVIGYFASFAAFPFLETPIASLAVQAPLIFWTARRLANISNPWKPGEWFLLGFVLWLVLQTAAISYGRAGYSDAIISRYLDISGLLLAANAGAIALLLNDETLNRPTLIKATVFLWAFVVAFPFLQNGLLFQNGLSNEFPKQWDARIERLRTFITTGDESIIRDAPDSEKVFPHDDFIIELLGDPRLIRWLPPSIRPPIQLESAKNIGFVEGLPREVDSPRPENSRTWYADGAEPALWQSVPKSADEILPILRFRFAGSPALGNDALRLTGDNGEDSELNVTGFMGNRWQRGHLFVPRGAKTVALSARTASQGNWLAFSEPVEVGWGGYVAKELRRHSQYLVVFGAIVLGFGLLFPQIASQQWTPSSDASPPKR